jgi:hypothetical protein
MAGKRYFIYVVIDEFGYIVDNFPKKEMAEVIANKYYAMINPPQVFAFDELIAIFDLLECQKFVVTDDNFVMGDVCFTNGIVSVGIITETKHKDLKLINNHGTYR